MICNGCHRKLLETYNFFMCIQETENHFRGILDQMVIVFNQTNI